MTPDARRERLNREMEKYASLSYEQADALSPQRHQDGAPGADEFCQIDVRVQQRVSTDAEQWVEVVVSIDDGTSGRGMLTRLLHATAPAFGSLVFHRDGRVERFFRDR